VIRFFSILCIIFSLLVAGCSASPEPFNLPIPFSGTLTSDTNVLIAEGNPLGGPNASLNLSLTNQSQINNQLPICWELFDATSGVSNGTFCFNSMTNPELTPLAGVGIRRVYTLDACATIGIDREACSSTFKVFDFPTDYIPSAELVDFCATLPGTHAEVRKLTGSGNINVKDARNKGVVPGQLLDGKLLVGTCCSSGDEECFLRTQFESAVVIHGTPISPLARNPDGKVVFTMITQGGALPNPEDPLGINFHILLPGSEEIAGEFFGTQISGQTIPPDLPLDQAEVFDSVTDNKFLLNDSQSSRLVVHNARILAHRVPELDEPIREFLRNNFANTPGVTPRLLEEGAYLTNSVEEVQSAPINCDPAMGEATGIFQDLCIQFGPNLLATFLCTALGVLTDPPVNDGFMFTGVWSIIRE
jgi:hypothetical protein